MLSGLCIMDEAQTVSQRLNDISRPGWPSGCAAAAIADIAAATVLIDRADSRPPGRRVAMLAADGNRAVEAASASPERSVSR